MFNKFFNLLIALLLFSVIFVAIEDSAEVWGAREEVNYIGIEKIAGGPDVGGGIFSDFIFAFELLSLLLLAALIGGLYIAKKEA